MTLKDKLEQKRYKKIADKYLQDQLPIEDETKQESILSEIKSNCSIDVKGEFQKWLSDYMSFKKTKEQLEYMKNEIDRQKRDIENLLLFMKKNRDKMSGEQYEVYCGIVLYIRGYTGIDLTPVSGDFGADIIAWKDNEKCCFQCKCYSSPVGVQAVQEVHSAKTYYSCSQAYVLTNNRFTDAALELAEKLDVIMIDDF